MSIRTMASYPSPSEIVIRNRSILDQELTDGALAGFFQQCFQDIVDVRGLYPFWVCIDCKKGDFGQKPRACPFCGKRRVFEAATFQGRGTATGAVFQEAVWDILNRFFPELGVVQSKGTPYKDHCDLFVPDVAGIEVKGSPEQIATPDGATIAFPRPGMRRSDTEKKANSNAATFKEDHRQRSIVVRFYVLTNAIPEGWQEEHASIDSIYDVTQASQWAMLAADLTVDKDRAARTRLGRR